MKTLIVIGIIALILIGVKLYKRFFKVTSVTQEEEEEMGMSGNYTNGDVGSSVEEVERPHVERPMGEQFDYILENINRLFISSLLGAEAVRRFNNPVQVKNGLLSDLSLYLVRKENWQEKGKHKLGTKLFVHALHRTIRGIVSTDTIAKEAEDMAKDFSKLCDLKAVVGIVSVEPIIQLQIDNIGQHDQKVTFGILYVCKYSMESTIFNKLNPVQTEA